MLKKAGIVVAVTTAGLLAVSPLAFAGDYDDGGHDGHGHDHGDGDRHGHHSSGLINVSDNAVQVPIQACGNDVLSGVLGVLSSGQKNSSNDDTKCDQSNSKD